MTQHPPSDGRLDLTPPLDAGDVAFLTGFSRHAGRVARIWPGQPAVPAPWVPCADGCCLVLVPTRASPEAAGQWLRFLIAEFLGTTHRVDGWVDVPGPVGRSSTLLIVEAGEVFEGDLGDAARLGSTR